MLPIAVRTDSAALDWRTTHRAREHALQRPSSRRSGFQPSVVGGNALQQSPLPMIKQEYEWSKVPELVIRLRKLPPTTTTYDIYRNFKKYGTIAFIELFEGRSGTRDGSGKIRFSPPPKHPFWTQLGPGNLHELIAEDGHSKHFCVVEFDDRNKKRLFKIQSPINKSVFYDEKMRLIPASLHFGLMLGPESLMTMESINGSPGDELSFVVDLLRNRIIATFLVDFKDPRSKGDRQYVSRSKISEYDRKNKYMFQIPFAQLKTIYRVDLSDSKIALVISLDSPPSFFRKREDEKSCHSNENLLWSEFDTWYRQTDVVYDPYRLTNATVTLHKERPVIDIGTSSTFLN